MDATIVQPEDVSMEEVEKEFVALEEEMRGEEMREEIGNPTVDGASINVGEYYDIGALTKVNKGIPPKPLSSEAEVHVDVEARAAAWDVRRLMEENNLQ